MDEICGTVTYVNAFLRELREHSVVRSFPDGSIRVYCGNVPLGRKLQTKGPRCKGGRHAFVRDVYEGLRHEYIDDVCTKCGRRVMIK